MPSRSHAPSYAAVLRTPSCARLFTAALVGRLSYGTVSLSLVLALTAATRSYAAAGVVMALFGLAVSFLSPARAGLIDRYGWRRALPPMAIAYAGLLLLIAASTWRPGASQVALGVLAVAAGACAPPLGPVMRSLWNDLLPDRRMLQRAYSLDMVAEELLFVTGPLLAGLLANVAVPSAGLVLSAALVLTGTLALVRSPDAGPDTRAGGGGPPEATVARIPRRRLVRSVMGLGLPMATVAVAGIGLGALSLVILAFAQQRHQTAAVALAEAALAAGSAVGGLAYGTVAWRGSARVRLRVLGAGLGLAIAVAGLAPNLYALVAILAIAGLFVAPVLSTAYLVADESASPGQRVRAGAWVNTAFNAGSSAGTAAFGLLIGRLPLALCFVVAGAPAVVSAATAVGRTRRHCPTHPRGCGNIQR